MKTPARTDTRPGSRLVRALPGLLTALCLTMPATANSPSELERYNVVWTTAGRSDRSSMPLGNGEVGISLWVKEDGDLEFYMARSDALTELDRGVKLGKVRLTLSPNPFARGKPFRQELKLGEGCVEIVAGEPAKEVRIRVFVDRGSSTIHLTGECASPTRATASYRTWRTAPRPPGWDSCLSLNPPVPIWESQDFVEDHPGGVLFYHRNGPTCVRFHALLQGLGKHLEAVPDSLENRTFGGWMTLTGAGPAAGGALATAEPTKAFSLKITTHSAQTAKLAEWVSAVRGMHESTAAVALAAGRTADWWRGYWQRSWIFVEGDSPLPQEMPESLGLCATEPGLEEQPTPSVVTRAYVLTKWMFACCVGGTFPMRYNGALFNLMPGGGENFALDNFARVFTAPPVGEPTLDINPDERSWAHDYLYQNLRLPYLSMLARDEADWIRDMFRFYARVQDLDRVRARLYHDAEGQHNTELMLSFGLQAARVYGYNRPGKYDRRGKPPGYAVNRWGGGLDISPGLELTHLMLDYHEYTRDGAFLRQELLPYARDLLRYIETRFKERRDGKIVIAPLNAVETYFDTTDPLPVVAGMHAVLERILALPPHQVADRTFFERLRGMTPEIPTEEAEGRTVLAPARLYDPKRQNMESPAFYAIFPFRLYGIGKPQREMAIASYRHALEVAGGFKPFRLGEPLAQPCYSGWQQTGMVAALLGLTEDARTVLENNCRMRNPGTRFAAMWGPTYDSVPDVDHGANVLNTLQRMAFQADGDRILVLPAWPKEWNVSFKFHAPAKTTVECVYRHGKIEKLEVVPAARKKDVRVCLTR